ncbi:uncharacterized protein LOC142539269 isoform X2 [Primulina tabacum]|uniref:uncharacterized protein LOC142539269 isoform X2 n=1 Tax=Primulina tabacum TaxID=48773 RepID=UPI003F5A95FA
MEAMRASYGESFSGSDSESELAASPTRPDPTQLPVSLPPPPLSLLHPPNSLGTFDYLVQSDQPNPVRSFRHMEGNFALHVYIPDKVSLVVLIIIPLTQRQETTLFLKRVARLVPEFHVVDVDIPSRNLIKDEQKFERRFHFESIKEIPWWACLDRDFSLIGGEK